MLTQKNIKIGGRLTIKFPRQEGRQLKILAQEARHEMDSRRSTALARPGPDLDSPSTTKLPLQSGGGWCLATGRGYETAWVSPGGTAHNDVPPHIRSVLNAHAPAADVTPADVEASPDGSWLVADGSTVYHMGGGWWKKTHPTNGTVFYVNGCTGESTRDEPDIPSSSDGEGDSNSGQASPAPDDVRSPRSPLRREAPPTDASPARTTVRGACVDATSLGCAPAGGMRAPAGGMNAWGDELVAPTPSAAPDESESDSDLTPINGVAFADAAAWTTRTHAMIHGHNDGSTFKTVAKEIERVYEVKMSKTWRRRLKTLWRRQIPLEVSVANALVGAGESDSDSSRDESNPDEEDDSGAAPGFAPTADAAEEDFGAPAADDAGPDIPDAGLEPALVPATADAPAPAAAPAPAFTLSPRLVDLQLPPAMQEILQQRLQANKQGIN